MVKFTAEEAFYDLPSGWEVGIGEDDHAGIPYFYNAETGESDWKHPREEMCIRRVKNARMKRQERLSRRDASELDGGDLTPRGARGERNRQAVFGGSRGGSDGGRVDRGDRGGNGNRRGGDVEVSEVVEVEDFEEEEDYPDSDPLPITRGNNRQRGGAGDLKASAVAEPGTEVKASGASRSTAGPAATGGFGMSPDDFLDTDAPDENTDGNTAGGIGERPRDAGTSPKGRGLFLNSSSSAANVSPAQGINRRGDDTAVDDGLNKDSFANIFWR